MNVEEEKNVKEFSAADFLESAFKDAGLELPEELKAKPEEKTEEKKPETSKPVAKSKTYITLPSAEGQLQGVDYSSCMREILTSPYGENLYRRGSDITYFADGKLKFFDADEWACELNDNFINWTYHAVNVKAKPATDTTPAEPAKIEVKKVLTIADARTARVLMKSRAVLEMLEPVDIISTVPIITPSGEIVSKGCHNGTLVSPHAKSVKITTPKRASEIIRGLWTDYNFLSRADESKMIAMIFSLAMKNGGLLKNIKCPIFNLFCNESHGGKGLATYMLSNIYNADMKSISQDEKFGGIGSMKEKIDSAVISGVPLIRLDNLTNDFRSPHLEMLLTEMGTYDARTSYSKNIPCTPASRTFLITANIGVTFSEDLMNRSYNIRFDKQPENYKYKVFEGGLGVLDYIIQNRAEVLGAIYTILQDWIANGKQRKSGPFHDFRDFTEMMNYIVDYYFQLPSPAEGHQASKAIRSNATAAWLYAIGQCLISHGKSNESFNTSQLIDTSVNVYKVYSMPTQDSGALGKSLAPLFPKPDNATEDSRVESLMEDIIWTKTITVATRANRNTFDEVRYSVRSSKAPAPEETTPF